MIYLSLHHNILLFVLHKNLNLSIHLAIKSIFKRKMEVVVDFLIDINDDFYNQTSACEISLLKKYLFLHVLHFVLNMQVINYCIEKISKNHPDDVIHKLSRLTIMIILVTLIF